MTTTDSLAALLERISDQCALCPELRFGQLMATIGMLAGMVTVYWWGVASLIGRPLGAGPPLWSGT